MKIGLICISHLIISHLFNHSPKNKKIKLMNYENNMHISIQEFFGYRFRSFAANSKDELVNLGFPSFTVEDFHDTVS